MNNNYRTVIDIDLGFEVNPNRPFSIYSEKVSNARCIAAHSHPRAQLIYCDTGIMEITAGKQMWMVNPLQGVWIPGNVEHQVFFSENANINTIFIDPSLTENLPDSSFAFDMSPFFKNLVLKIMSVKDQTNLSIQQQRITAVLLDELMVIGPSLTFLPLSTEPRLRAILEEIQKDLSYRLPIEYFANNAGMSSRTLSRLFLKELGITFSDWRTRTRLLEAIKRLENKQAVKEIAFETGYENASSFIYTFKKYFGKTPGNYWSLGLI